MPVSHDYITTYTGKRFSPLSARIEDIDIKDIAHALACQSRFGGMCREPYSIAQHSVLCAEWVVRNSKCNPYLRSRLQFDALMHDASEAYLGDVPTPIKHSKEFIGYCVAEDVLMDLISAKFGNRYPVPNLVRKADEVLLNTEARDIFSGGATTWTDLSLADPEQTITPWQWQTAERYFLRAFTLLTSGKGDQL